MVSPRKPRLCLDTNALIDILVAREPGGEGIPVGKIIDENIKRISGYWRKLFYDKKWKPV